MKNTFINTVVFFLLIVACHDVTYAQGNSSNFSLFSLGIQAPPKGYKGYVNSADAVLNGYNEATKFFVNNVNVGQTEKAIKFLNAGAAPYPPSRDAEKWIVYTIIKNKDYALLDAIHEKFPLMFKYSQALHYACVYSDSTMIDYLISKGADLNLNGLCLRDERQQGWGLKVAYPWNADTRFRMLPADCASLYNWKNLQYINRKYGANLSAHGISRAIYRFTEGNVGDQFVKLLMSFPNFDPNVRASELTYFSSDAWNDEDVILLEYMIRKGKKELAKQMIEMGADVNASKGSNSGLVCPLMTAVQTPNMQDIIELLLAKGAKTKMPFQYRTVNILDKARTEYKEWFVLNGYM